MKPATKAKYCLATNWDDALLESVTTLNHAHSLGAVTEVFGSHPITPTGTARPAYRLPSISDEAAACHIRKAHTLGIKFNYLMNAVGLDRFFQEGDWQARLGDFLSPLLAAGVELVTVADERLVQFLRRCYPQLTIKLSLLAQVRCVDDARRFEDMGVGVIVLDPFYLNRDFDALGEIRDAVDCELELYSNIPCLLRCPLSNAHYKYLSNASREGGNIKAAKDPYLATCSQVFMNHPVELIKSPFIRPEDIGFYTDLGFDRFKLSDRSETTAFLLKTARAYLSRKFDGNLFELVFRGGSKFRNGLPESIRMAEAPPPPIHIDSRKLDQARILERLRELPENEHDDFYRSVAHDVVSITDENGEAFWKENLHKAHGVVLPATHLLTV